jgi:hypothetical protein
LTLRGADSYHLRLEMSKHFEKVYVSRARARPGMRRGGEGRGAFDKGVFWNAE